MTDPRALYPEAILDHSRNPRNEGRPSGTTHAHTLSNPLCGDRVTICVAMEDDRATEVGFEVRGCALCIASASMLTEWARGRTRSEIVELRASVEAAVAAEGGATAPPHDVWNALRAFPARVRCATLPWEALTRAIQEDLPD